MQDILDRHDRIALQFSGGRDSLACLYLMRPVWDRLTVYWVNTGAAFPETLAIVAHIRAMVPHFVEIDGNGPGVIAQFGIPSDIVPASRTPMGIVGTGSNAPLIQDRYSCCLRTIMLPLHRRMLEDGVTLVIRGQKAADRHKAPIASGYIEDGIEYLFPIEGWDARRVDAYLREQEAPIARFYEVLDGAPDCMTCSGWWENGAAKYLKRYHYPEYQEVQRRLSLIREAVVPHVAAFEAEVNA